jgi:carboxyvinyl-carboxyphosphonate phosphorylmutase
MRWSKQRAALRAILNGAACIRPGSVYDATSARIAEDIGFELGMLGGSTASLTVLGDPDIMLLTLTELAETVRRITRAGELPLLVDADHGFGNALNVRRTVEELESAGAAGLTIEDTLLPTPYGKGKAELISRDEAAGKMKAACDARCDPQLSIFARTAVNIVGLDEAVARATVYETTGVDALFFTGIRTRAELETASRATKLPIMLGTTEKEIDDVDYLAGQRVRIANQGHTPFAAATQAVYETLKALREGTSPKELKGLPSADLVNGLMRQSKVKDRLAAFLGIR